MRGFIVYNGLAAVNILHLEIVPPSVIKDRFGVCQLSPSNYFLNIFLNRGDAELLPEPPKTEGLESDFARPITVRIGPAGIRASLALFQELRPARFSEIPPDVW